VGPSPRAAGEDLGACWRRLSPQRLGTQVGRVAFKRRVTPLEGDHVFVLPYASCLSTFQAPGWGIPAVFPPHRWRNATPWELVPFSHRSASRIFISQPGCTPRRRLPKTVTTSPWLGTSKLGCDLGPTLSFKDVHHPRWGGGRAEPELYLPRGFVGHPLLRRSRGARWPYGRVRLRQRGAGRRQASSAPARRARRLGPSAPSCRKAAAAPCAREDRPRCRALLGRRSCSRVVLPLHRYGASARRSVPCSSGRIRVGICRRADGPCRRCRGGGGSRSPRRRRDHRHHPRFGPPALCTCPRPSSVGVGEGRVAAAFALRPSPLQFGHP
jgi:hypothetical protein